MKTRATPYICVTRQQKSPMKSSLVFVLLLALFSASNAGNGCGSENFTCGHTNCQFPSDPNVPSPYLYSSPDLIFTVNYQSGRGPINGGNLSLQDFNSLIFAVCCNSQITSGCMSPSCVSQAQSICNPGIRRPERQRGELQPRHRRVRGALRWPRCADSTSIMRCT